jgi:uncharacterized protein (TIGR02246 family)
MKHALISRIVLLSLIAGVLGISLVKDLQAQAFPSSLEDTKAIERLVAAEAGAWNHGDAKAFAARFAEDGTFTNVIGATYYGREAFEQRHADILATIYKGSSLNMTIARLHFLRADVALADVDAAMSGYKKLPPVIQAGPDGVVHSKLLLVLVKEKGEWWIAAFHNVGVVPLPATR